MVSYEADGVSYSISDKLGGLCTASDLLSSEGTIHCEMDLYDNNSSGNLFLLKSPEYGMQCGFHKGNLFLRRNNDIVASSVKNISARDVLEFFIIWDPEHIELVAFSKKDRANDPGVIARSRMTVVTRPTNPPLSLLSWARRHRVIGPNEYDSYSDLKNSATEIFVHLQDKINVTACQKAFWNYEPSTKVSKPVHEPEATTTIHGILYDHALSKALELIPQSGAAGGNVDFLICGSVKKGGIGKIAVEAKNAHSPKLFDGIEKQLPAYMSATSANFGIYLILCYHGEADSYDDDSIRIKINKFITSNSIRVVYLDLSQKCTPSKL